MKKLVSVILSMLFYFYLLTGCASQENEDVLAEDQHLQTASASDVLPESEEISDAIAETSADMPLICLDAGHGFADPGCESEYLSGYESEINLAITLMLKEKLQECGAKVILTHDGNSFPSAEEIALLADTYGIGYRINRLDGNDIFSAYERGIYAAALHEQESFDLFLSLHINSAEDYPDTSRYELYYYEDNPNAAMLAALCGEIAAEMDNETRVTPTNYDDSYYVTKYTKAAAVLFEMGYATNQSDAANLNSAKWRDWLTDLLTEKIMLQFDDIS